MHVYHNYRIHNIVALNYAAFACVGIVVFLSSTQPFFLSEVLNVADDSLAGIIGTLGFADELTAMAFAPIAGAMLDKLNLAAECKFSGPRIVQSTAFLLVACALLAYGTLSTNVYPQLLLFRCVFAVGVVSCMSMVTVFLNELSLLQYKNKSGKQAALVGVSCGLGAIALVLVLLPMPLVLTAWFPSLASSLSLRYTYCIVAIFSAILWLATFTFLYDWKVHGDQEDVPEGMGGQGQGQYALFVELLTLARQSSATQLAFLAGFVARATSVALAVFVPLVVYKFYSQTGKCADPDNPNQRTCRDGYVFAAILTGVGQTVGLILAPVWGIAADCAWLGKHASLIACAIAGMLGSFGMCLVHPLDNSHAYDLRNAWGFVLISLLGMSQIGLIITSMSLLSSAHGAQRMGGLSGLYSFCGGLGILVITKGGAIWSDHWGMGPFMLLGIFNVVLAAACAVTYMHPPQITSL